MLEKNFGRLEPHLWEALYLVINLPSGIDRNLDESFTAIPGLFLGHLRHFLGGLMPLDSPPYYPIAANGNGRKLPSKFRALLADLPRDELSVVFASSKSVVLHLQRVLHMEAFRSKTLFVGQSERETECAISDWESKGDNATILIVQAGAAACGLTLTAASKMFLVEPFRKHEEEKQAYARLHRYGQKNAVHCKVYYTPVSVESRLLEWRRRATTHAPEEEKTVYAPMRRNDKIAEKDIDDDNDDRNHNYCSDDDESKTKGGEETGSKESSDSIEEENQTRFLLGLTTTAFNEVTEISSTDGSSRDEEAVGTLERPIEL